MSTSGPSPVTGTFIGPLSSIASGVLGVKYSWPNVVFDETQFTVTVAMAGQIPYIRITLDPTGSAAVGDLTARSLILGAGYPNVTNLDVTGSAYFRGPVSLTAGAVAPWIEWPTTAAPADPASGHVRAYFDGSRLRSHYNGGIDKSLYPWPAMAVNVPPVVTGADQFFVLASSGPVDSLGTQIAAVGFTPAQTIATSFVNYATFVLQTRSRATGALTTISTDLGYETTQAGFTEHVEYALWSPATPFTLDDGLDLVLSIAGSGVCPLTKWSAVCVVPG